MITVLRHQMLRLVREPLLLISFLLMTIIFVFTMVGANNDQTHTIPVYSSTLSQEALQEKVELLNADSPYIFEIESKEAIETRIQSSDIPFALSLESSNFKVLVGQESQLQTGVSQHVENVYRTQLTLDQVQEAMDDIVITQKEIVSASVSTLKDSVTNIQSSSASILVGLTLYFSALTILSSLTNVTQEKITGTWNRMILSPLKKTQIYSGILIQYFMIGVFQILACFFIFKHFFNFDFGNQYGSILMVVGAFVFVIVSLGILIISMVNSPQQLQVVIPIFATAFAMLGGAFWPLEIVTNNILLSLAKVTPIYYGMEGLKGAILLNQGLSQMVFPVSIMAFMGVLFMGVGLNKMERK
ncbi:hypothetical protein AOC36_04320 [Erysipelothrix larvae]|uniref:ABC transmembrane type-2 domain-containing protein n=1 Tax=Erysipelothrix larvae TaxID=1514105 RepID=A0A109UGX2_9FIRM|nr:ABC transporter permease [Erysipelothrix larvae]AMC93223.1 hypothetical protein AOC36_04320 [Erysipelothrix larvae]